MFTPRMTSSIVMLRSPSQSPAHGKGVGVAVGVETAVSSGVAEGLGVAVGVSVGVPVGVMVLVRVPVRTRVPVRVRVRVGVGVLVGVRVGEMVGVVHIDDGGSEVPAVGRVAHPDRVVERGIAPGQAVMDIEICPEAVADAPSASQIPGKLAKERGIVPAGVIGPAVDDARLQRRGGRYKLQPATQDRPGRRPGNDGDRDAAAGVVRVRIPAAPVRSVDEIEAGRERGANGEPHQLAGLRHGPRKTGGA